MKSRTEKIKFLQGVLTGQRKVEELLSMSFDIYIEMIKEDGTKAYLHDGKILSQEKYEKRAKGKVHNITLVMASKTEK